jgi:L-alanine-DL-glutamate epimerase-like enolase superfamily enzyme
LIPLYFPLLWAKRTLGLSAVEIALWNIAGKAANAPLYQLLGGGVSDLVCYASLVHYSDPLQVRANIGHALDPGFRNVKLHEIELEALRAAREEPGVDVELMLDVNYAWSLTETRRRAEASKQFRLNGSKGHLATRKL